LCPPTVSHAPYSFPHSCPPSHLHSFPTRRSSDLARSGRADPRNVQGTGRRLEPLTERQAALRKHAVRAPRRAYAAPLASSDHFRDRKSTRLNSSHVSISYAVFCLKKKTKK